MFNFIKNEHDILKLWQSKDVFAQMREKNHNSKELYRTLDGPITANAAMGIHHIWGRMFKDAIIKYNTLKGRKTHFQNGFDAQGMWVEVEVEKLLGLNDKKAILDYGLDKFTEKCIERVNHFANIQTNQSIRIGQIMDWDNSYFTNSDHNIECIWNFLRVCNERGMLVRSYKSMPWCPRCGTSLSEHEMNGSYKESTHKAVFVKTKLHSGERILVWTTTPWTLSSNVAIAINPKHKYLKVKVHSDPDLLIVGKEALKIIPKKDLIEVVSEFNGAELVGKTYHPIMPLKIQQFEHTIIPWEDVSATDGTGAVHIAPGCGAEDFELGKKHGLRQIVPIDESGIFTDEFEFLAGLSTSKCEDVVFNKLQETGMLFYTHDFKHNYPFCWRCKTDVVFKLVDGWDIVTAKIKPDLLRAARTVKWEPAFLQKTMEHWLENMGDWNISRRRFYGLPLPIYPCDCGHFTVVGSKSELKKLAIKPELVDKIPHLHRPYIDGIEIKCKCGKPVKRVLDVGDCWLDAGIAPFSTAAKDYTPFQVVIEMKEQIRLWFYSQLFMSVVLAGKAPYKQVIGYGTVLKEDGRKFSKTDKDNLTADVACEKYGADVIRYLYASGNPVNDVRIGPNLIDEARRKLLGIYNNFVFFNTYAKIDKPNIVGHIAKNLHVTDMWLIETLNNYVRSCEKSYEQYKLHEVIENTDKLVEDLSNFYIRVNRRRFWKNDNGTDKLNAYWCLYHTLKSIALVLAPITPFFCEHVWQTTVKTIEPKESDVVMAADFARPLSHKCTIKNLPEKVVFIQQIISNALSLRARENLKLKQPLRTLYIKAQGKHDETIKAFADILRDEINVKNIEIVTTEDQFNIPYLSVDFKKAGALLKGEVQALKNLLLALNPIEMAKAVAQCVKGSVNVGKFMALPSDIFERKLKSKTEFVSSTEGDLTVVLDTTLDDELIAEGMLREIIRAIQVARQTKGFEITSRIDLLLFYEATSKGKYTEKLIIDNLKKICEETLAVNVKTEVRDPKTKFIHDIQIDVGETQLFVEIKVVRK